MSGCHVPEYAKVEIKTDIEIVVEMIDLLRNSISDLSLRMHKMQSNLREFEKQKVDGISKRLDEAYKILDHHTQQLVDLEDRLDTLEAGEDW